MNCFLCFMQSEIKSSKAHSSQKGRCDLLQGSSGAACTSSWDWWFGVTEVSDVTILVHGNPRLACLDVLHDSLGFEQVLINRTHWLQFRPLNVLNRHVFAVLLLTLCNQSLGHSGFCFSSLVSAVETSSSTSFHFFMKCSWRSWTL